jgi:malonyl-CoA O-methyltransferase
LVPPARAAVHSNACASPPAQPPRLEPAPRGSEQITSGREGWQLGGYVIEAPESTVLDPAEGYARWASTYERETIVSLLDEKLVAGLTPPLMGRRLLDIGCGTGRRMVTANASSAVGVEPSREMIAAGALNRRGRPELSVRQGQAGDLPVADQEFDVVWCRLVLGHVADLARPYSEMARALSEDGSVVVSDFHPEAQARGHRRTFRSGSEVCEILSHPHSLADHVAAAAAAGLALVDGAEAPVGPAVRHLYAEAGRLALYEDHFGLPLVFALRFERG